MPALQLDAEPEGPRSIPGIPLQKLRIHLRRTERPARAGGEKLKKKQDSFEEDVRQTVREELTKKVDEGALTPPKRLRQKDLEGGILPDVTRETEEQPPLNVFRAGRLVIKLTDDAMERVLTKKKGVLTKKKDQTSSAKETELKRWVQGRAKITGADPILVGEYDYAVEALWNDFKEML